MGPHRAKLAQRSLAVSLASSDSRATPRACSIMQQHHPPRHHHPPRAAAERPRGSRRRPSSSAATPRTAGQTTACLPACPPVLSHDDAAIGGGAVDAPWREGGRRRARSLTYLPVVPACRAAVPPREHLLPPSTACSIAGALRAMLVMLLLFSSTPRCRCRRRPLYCRVRNHHRPYHQHQSTPHPTHQQCQKPWQPHDERSTALVSDYDQGARSAVTDLPSSAQNDRPSRPSLLETGCGASDAALKHKEDVTCYPSQGWADKALLR